MTELEQENMELRRQLLSLHIQNALIMQNFAAFTTNCREAVNDLAKKIPKEHEVTAFIQKENAKERAIFIEARDEAVILLNKLREMTGSELSSRESK